MEIKEYYEALAEAPITALWAAVLGAASSAVGGVWLFDPAPLRDVKVPLVLVPALFFYLYKRARAKGLNRAEAVKSAFVAEAKAAARAELLAPLDWIDAVLVNANWNRMDEVVEISIKVISPAVTSKEIRSIALGDNGGAAPVSVEVVIAGVRYMVPHASGETVVSVGGEKHDAVFTFRRAGRLPDLGLSPNTWATQARFVLHTNPPLSCSGVLPITGAV